MTTTKIDIELTLNEIAEKVEDLRWILTIVDAEDELEAIAALCTTPYTEVTHDNN